jgi:hypothetical protein
MNHSDKEKFDHEAEGYEQWREKLSNDQLDNFRIIKSHLADWYIAIAATCFAIGGIAITVGKHVTTHPALFWWGSVLLIANGVFIFFFRKIEIQAESSGFSDLKQKEADLLTMSKIAHEHAMGDNSRSEEFIAAANRFIDDYDKHSVVKWWQWIKFIAQANLLDVVFGLLLFPILLLAPQLSNYLQITFETYALLLWGTLVIYFAYMASQIIKSIKEKKKSDAAARQIKSEVDKNRTNYR